MKKTEMLETILDVAQCTHDTMHENEVVFNDTLLQIIDTIDAIRRQQLEIMEILTSGAVVQAPKDKEEK